MASYLAIIGTKDNPVYELEIIPIKEMNEDILKSHLHQFVAHASLDLIEQGQWTSNSLYLRSIDQFHDTMISAFLTPSNIKFILLHKTKNDDGIKLFFQELHELYIKMLMNPFYEPNQPIHSQAFDLRVRTLAKRQL
ncbi:TRAPP complex subunit Trs20 [Schizosaccharomyces japonicus yFS275]|uniref:TRAPP complex subunit Trs20 n=1 Tax=Schizosaccharomyces japonicus (strain yFS275 / FY16936) TaxID=402676 RepID=B6K4B3_SCHJY|nr:TRAPP complex subunit Trs20 [Schizosaccharomyces japonicus yFS275]EEB08320.1 TRAPP complex subunit Trs20 [Schizosaccharomyces japonicus yFS275]